MCFVFCNIYRLSGTVLTSCISSIPGIFLYASRGGLSKQEFETYTICPPTLITRRNSWVALIPNGIFTIAVNLEKFDGDRFTGSGKKKGVLGVQSDTLEPLIEGESEGVWYRNYFKYIHAPENTEELIFQHNKLVELNIMSEQNKISKDEWELLKYLRCVVPPSKYKSPENI